VGYFSKAPKTDGLHVELQSADDPSFGRARCHSVLPGWPALRFDPERVFEALAQESIDSHELHVTEIM
jgi:hypothetical protein